MDVSRAACVVLCLAVDALAHGGAFRPPPGGRPGDPYTPPGPSPRATTARATGSIPNAPWEVWWGLNRDRYLRLRERIEERTVVTGRLPGHDPFDRSALRANVLLPAMIEALGDEDEEVRTSACVAVGKFRATDLAARLQKMRTDDKILQVRESAMLGLMLLREPALRDFFRSIAADEGERPRMRGFAVLSLGFLGDEEHLSELARRGGELLKGAGTTTDDLRACAVLGLGFCSGPGAAAAVIAAARDPKSPPAARGIAGSALARLGCSTAVPDLLQFLRDGDEMAVARQGAAIGLGALVRPEEEALVDFLGKKSRRDRDGGVRTLAGMSLGRIGGESAAVHLVSALNECEQAERGFFLLALGLSRSADAGPILLERFAKLSNNSDRAACALALGLAGYREAAPAIRAEVERGNRIFVARALTSLGLLDDEASIPLVQEILRKSRDPGVQREGAMALALLRRAAAIPDLLEVLGNARTTLVRGAVAEAIGLVGGASAVEPLLGIVRDRSRQGEERAMALAALGRIGDPERVPFLAQVAFDLNPYVIVDAIAEVLTIL
jgi:HEAT repeat protein